jgi:hypothetical protein
MDKRKLAESLTYSEEDLLDKSTKKVGRRPKREIREEEVEKEKIQGT